MPPSSQRACKYWQAHRGCFSGQNCLFVHDSALHEQNKCHKFQRGCCRYGDDCARIHEMPSGEDEEVSRLAAPGSPSEEALRGMKRMLEVCMEKDREELDAEARKKKFKWYVNKFHPDKWMQASTIAEKLATPVTFFLLARKDTYIQP